MTQGLNQAKTRHVHRLCGPKKVIHDPHDRNAEQNAKDPVPTGPQVGAGFKFRKYGHRKRKADLKPGVIQSGTRRPRPGTEQKKRGQRHQKTGDRVGNGLPKNQPHIAQEGAEQGAGEPHDRFTNVCAEGAVRNDDGGEDRGIDVSCIHAENQQCHDGAGNAHLERPEQDGVIFPPVGVGEPHRPD